MAQKTKNTQKKTGRNKLTLRRRDGQTVVVDGGAGTIAFETNGVTLVLDGKAKTITLSAASVVLQSPQILLARANDRHPVVLNDVLIQLLDQHRHFVTRAGAPTGPPL